MKDSKVLKWLSYIVLPIAFAILIISLFYSMNTYSYRDEIDILYFESDRFVENFMNNLKNTISELIHSQTTNYYIGRENSSLRVNYGSASNVMLNVRNFKYVIIYTPRNKVITNVMRKADSLEELLKYIENAEGKKVTIEEGQLTTDISIINENWENYVEKFNGSYYYDNTQEGVIYEQNVQSYDEKSRSYLTNYNNLSNVTYEEYDINDFKIYISYEEEFTQEASRMVSTLKSLMPYENWLYASIPVSTVIILLCAIYLEISIGYRKDKEGIDLNDIDKLPLEILLAIIGIVLVITFAIFDNVGITIYNYSKLYLCMISTIYLVIYILFALLATTVIKRIKAKVFWQNTLIYKFYKLIEKLCKKFQTGINKFTFKISEIKRLAIFVVCYFIIMALIMILFNTANNLFLGILIDIAITLYLLYKVKLRINCFIKIEEQLKKIYEGNHDEKLNEEEFTEEFKEVVRYINDISNGFENAVQERIKSERLKTELITNVSHDIKTPLTSIINYVDLIKRENIDNEKVKEYIQILESKSHRLKRLMEDLVEASKASSRKRKINFRKIKFG